MSSKTKYSYTKGWSSADRRRNHTLLSKYGITLNQYNTLRSIQKYRCAICHEHESDVPKGLVVDHSHESGNVRGLLCTSCNTALGLFYENTYAMQKAITYLIENNKTPLEKTFETSEKIKL